MAVTVDKEVKKVSKGRKIFIGVDKTLDDVVKYVQNGNKLFFEDDADTFLEIPQEIVDTFSVDAKQRYRVSKSIAEGSFDMQTAVDGVNGFKIDYDTIPGSAQANLDVFGKKPDRDYLWMRKDKVDKHKFHGTVVDRDPDVYTRNQGPSGNGSGSAKYVGGEKNHEMVLGVRPKSVSKADKARRKELRTRLTQRQQDSTREAFEKVGVRVVEE